MIAYSIQQHNTFDLENHEPPASRWRLRNKILIQAKLHHNCKNELRDASLKATPARLAVLDVLEKTDAPLAVSAILTSLQKQKIDADPATVFRIMNLFTEKGLARPVHLQEGKLRYEYADKAEHHHLICESCGLIEDVSDCNIEQLEIDIARKKQFTIKRHSLEFFGICHLCQH